MSASTKRPEDLEGIHQGLVEVRKDMEKLSEELDLRRGKVLNLAWDVLTLSNAVERLVRKCRAAEEEARKRSQESDSVAIAVEEEEIADEDE